MVNGGMRVDDDGFLVSDTPPVVAPAPVVAVPKFFDGCRSIEEAAAKMIDELSKPFSYEMEGYDEMYARLSRALILVLSIQAGFTP